MAIQFREGTATIGTPGTPVALGTGRALWVMVQANSFPLPQGNIVIGSAAVRAASEIRTGIEVMPPGSGQPVKLEGGYDNEGGRLDLATIFVDGTSAGDKVHWLAAIP